jgi:putative hemolysin
MLIDLSLLFVLFVLNGLFAMSEIAVVSSRRSRLQQMADGGNAGAGHALALASEPTRFLSSVQVGITSIGILSGAIGESAVASRLRAWLEGMPAVAAYADILATILMVLTLTYVSLIVGELVPKRLALSRPERIAAVIATPMQLLATVARPVVSFLSLTTDAILRLFGMRHVKQGGVTVDEVRIMLKQGAEQGVFEPAEQEMATNILNLDERHVDDVMTSRSEIVYLDVRDSLEANQNTLRQHPHGVLPLCDGGLDHVVGFVRSKHLLEAMLGGRELDLRAVAESAVFVPERMTIMRLLEEFKRANLPLALVVDEFGDVEGLVSLTDVVSSIVGDLPVEDSREPMIRRREDGTWLIDGALDLDTLLRTLDAEDFISKEDREHYHTLGGLVILALGRVPRTGDVFERGGYRFEVIDMDGNRVDRVLVSPLRR